jgi:murein DD-endopeptidase MepM/ murein hydrolase activator NlpD
MARMRRASLALLLTVSIATAGQAAEAPDAAVAPGRIVRWPGPSLLDCSLGERHWKPLDGACWYAIDLGATGSVELVRRSTGGVASRRLRVAPYPYPEQRLEVEERYVEPPPDEIARIARERRETLRALALRTPRRFTLPLAPPLDPLPTESRFGARRIFNGEPRSPHSGADFAVRSGTPVRAVADGTVALTGEQYFAGNAVYIDHGDGLVSMSFHLSKILVRAGDSVRRGQQIGLSGATGRVTGPHLHFGIRWHGSRVDPNLLFTSDRATEVR